MRNLLFFFRIAFICNVCLLLSALSKYWDLLPEGFISSTVIVLGVGLSFFVNILANLAVLYLLLSRKKELAEMPGWLLIGNGLVLLVQVYLLVK